MAVNKEALNTMYNLAKQAGYTKSVEEYQKGLSSNPEMFNAMYKVAQENGYTKSVDDFSGLLGVNAKGAQSSDQFLKTKKMSPEQLGQFNEEWKQSALKSLASTYSGDFGSLLEGLQDENKQINIPEDFQDRKKMLTFIDAVQSVVDFNPSQGNPNDALTMIDDDNPYKDMVKRSGELGTWTEKSGDPSIKEVLFPNLSIRQQDPEKGIVSKGIGAVQDVLGAPARIATGLTEELTPQAGALTLSQRLARPMEYSTGGEQFFDALAPSMAGGGLVKKGGELIAKGAKFLKGGAKIGDIAQDVNKLGGNVYKNFAQKTLEGGGEGLAYGALPSATTATQTSVDPNAMEKGAMELVAGGVLGGLGGAIGGVIKKPNSAWGDEIAGKYGAVKRFEDYARELPPTSSIEGVEQISKLRGAGDEIKGIIGKERGLGNLAVAKKPLSEANQAESSQFFKGLMTGEDKGLARPSAEGGMYVNKFSPENIGKTLDDYSMANIDELPIELEGLYTKELDRVKANLIKKGESTPEALQKEATKIAKRGEKYNADNPNKEVYKTLGKTLVNTEKDLTEQYLAGGGDETAKNILSSREKFKEAYDVLDMLPKEGQEEKFLKKAGFARTDPIERGFEASTHVKGIEQLKELVKKYDVNLTNEEIDYLTPAVARRIRNKMTSGDGNLFDQMLLKLTKGASAYGPSKVLGETALGSAKLISKGVGIPQYLNNDNYEAPQDNVNIDPSYFQQKTVLGVN